METFERQTPIEEIPKNPEQAMNRLDMQKDKTIKQAEEIGEKGCLKINNFVWNHQKEACDFINNAFPDLPSLQLGVN